MLKLGDRDLLARLTNFEDHFVERKTASDKKDWLKTVAAFANSTPIDYPAVLFIGVRNNGSIEETGNLDKLQQTLSEILAEAYPPIPTFAKVLEKDGKQFLAVIVPGSGNRPHFSGPAYIRVKSETRKASEEQFAELIVQRNSKARYILDWKGKTISVGYAIKGTPTIVERPRTVVDCNQFYVTVEGDNSVDSIPLDRVSISYDNGANRLKLEVQPVLA